MAKSVNQVFLLGNLARDPELRYTAAGKAVASFTIVTDRSFKSGEEFKTEAEYTRCVAWGKTAEIVSQYLKKGSKTHVSGRLQTRDYEQAGVKKYVTEVVVNDISLLGGKSEGAVSDTAQPAPVGAPVEDDIDVDDIPF